MKEQLQWMLANVEIDGYRLNMRESSTTNPDGIVTLVIELYLGEYLSERVVYTVRQTLNEKLEPNEYERNLEFEDRKRTAYENIFITLLKLGIKCLMTEKSISVS